MSSEKVNEIVLKLKEYCINQNFDSEEDMIKWIKKLTKKKKDNILNLNINPKNIMFDSMLLVNKNLLSTDDYNERVKLLASINNADGWYHLFDRLLEKKFLYSEKFYSDIEKMKKASSAQTILWIIDNPVFINSPYHDEDLELLVNYRDKRGQGYDYFMMQAIATTAKCEASINSLYHQSDIKMYLKYENAIQMVHSYPERGINILGINEVSLKDKYHIENMEILANNQEIGSFLYAVMTDPIFIHSSNYRKIINKMVEKKNNREYVFLLCVYVLGEEKALSSCNLVDDFHIKYNFNSNKDLMISMINKELESENCIDDRKNTIKDNVSSTLLSIIGMTYDEFEKLDFEKQRLLISEYHKKHPDKDKQTLVMIGGGDESIFMSVPKGKKILTPNGYFIAGETLEENKKRFEEKKLKSDKKWKKFNKKMDKELSKTRKLDFKTWLYLYLTHVVRVEHPPVLKVDSKKTMYVKDSKENEVYVFDNYEDYKNYYLMYLDSIEDEVIDLAIYTKGSKGQIIALKGLCEHIIVKKKMNDFYNSITQEQIDEIHSKGKITPLEAVELWESFDLCIEGSKSVFSKSRCNYFGYNCHDCLMESASHKLEHEQIKLEIVNSIEDEVKKNKVMRKTSDN